MVAPAAVFVEPMPNTTMAMVNSCLVTWFCCFAFGLAAFIVASASLVTSSIHAVIASFVLFYCCSHSDGEVEPAGGACDGEREQHSEHDRSRDGIHLLHRGLLNHHLQLDQNKSPSPLQLQLVHSR